MGLEGEWIDMTAGLRIGVGGALGRMGRAVTAMVLDRDDLVLAGRFDRPGVAEDFAGAPPLSEMAVLLGGCDVVIDFSTGPATAALARMAAERGGPALVLGATGLSAAEEDAVREAARRVAVVKSGNYSLGVNILAGLVEQVARRLGPQAWDVEILEVHHRRKIDAPSGTALMLGEAAARGRGETLAAVRLPARDGVTGPRPAGGIGFGALRAGGIVGEHSVVFATEEESLVLSHSARDRTLFARGALAAAEWVVDRAPGLYDMADVLGFTS